MMKMQRSILSLVLTALMFTSAACSSAPAASSQSGSAGTSAASASSASGPVTITFDQFSGSGDNEQYLQKMIDAYKAENPNVTIKMQSYGYDDYFTQLTTKVAGGKAADVFELNYENFVSYAKKNALMPLDDLIKSQNVDVSIYNQTALKAFSADGKQYGVPDSFSTVLLFYNKDLFDKAKVSYPTDDWKWSDAMAAAQKIRALGKDTYGYYHPCTFNEFYKVAKQNGGGLISADGKSFTMDSPANVQALQYMVDMQAKTNVMPTAAQVERTANADWDLFKSGRLGMLVTGCWAFPDFAKNCNFKWDVVVEPGNTQKATHFFSNGYVINKDSKVADEAVKFITFISSNKEATQIRLDAGWELPPVNDKSIIDQYTAQTPPSNRQAVFKSLDYLVTPPVISQYQELQDIVGKHLDAAVAGTVTPAQAMKDMQADCTQKIDLSK